MRVIVAVLALVLALPAAAGAQIVRGAVLEEGTTTPIEGVTVELLATDLAVLATATTDANGWFQLEAEQEGRFLVRTAHPFYGTGRVDSLEVGRHETVTVTLRMARTPVPLEPLVVAARSRNPLQRFRTRAEEARIGRFVSRDFIARRPTSLPSELLFMTPGVRVVRQDGTSRSNVVLMRSGAGSCAANVYLDGLPVPQGLGFSIDELTAADLIEGIEIYDAYEPIPAEFLQQPGSCGVVAFWSRPEMRRPVRWKHLGIFGALAGALYLLTR